MNNAQIFAVGFEFIANQLSSIVRNYLLGHSEPDHNTSHEFDAGLLIDPTDWLCFYPLREGVNGDIEEFIAPFAFGKGPRISITQIANG